MNRRTFLHSLLVAPIAAAVAVVWPKKISEGLVLYDKPEILYCHQDEVERVQSILDDFDVKPAHFLTSKTD